MGSKRKNSRVGSDQDNDDEYRNKRDRNNQAVKRSRVKSKQRTQETQERVKNLKVKNQVLEEKIGTLNKDLKFLKELFLAQAQAKAEKLSNEELRQLLKDDEDSDDDNDDEDDDDDDDEAEGGDRRKPTTSKT